MADHADREVAQGGDDPTTPAAQVRMKTSALSVTASSLAVAPLSGVAIDGEPVGGGLLGGDDVVGGDRVARAESGGAVGQGCATVGQRVRPTGEAVAGVVDVIGHLFGVAPRGSPDGRCPMPDATPGCRCPVAAVAGAGGGDRDRAAV